MDEDEKSHAERTEHERILVIRNSKTIPKEFEKDVDRLISYAAKNQDDAVMKELHRMVPGFRSEDQSQQNKTN